jgi:hypothetical protein
MSKHTTCGCSILQLFHVPAGPHLCASWQADGLLLAVMGSKLMHAVDQQVKTHSMRRLTSCSPTHLQGRISVRPGDPMGLLLAVMGSKMLGDAHQPGRALPLSGYTWSSGHEPDSDACRTEHHVISSLLSSGGVPDWIGRYNNATARV